MPYKTTDAPTTPKRPLVRLLPYSFSLPSSLSVCSLLYRGLLIDELATYLFPMPTATPKQPKRKTLAPNAQKQHTTQVLAIASRLLREVRASTSLSSPLLSILYSAGALQVDKAGTFTAEQVSNLTGFSGWQTRQSITDLAASQYLAKVGGQQRYKSQRWALSPTGWQVVTDATQRANGYLSTLYNSIQ
jgi:hypothetical protein